MKNKKPILSVKNLSIGYPDKDIAKDISLNIHKQELIAVIGINGSGKSTFLKTITGNLPKKSSEILIHQKKLESFSAQQIAEYISIVFSNAVFSQNLSVYEVVSLGRNPYTNWLGLLTEKDKKAVAQALTLMEIKDLAHKKCSELSDGQLQKVFIARALAQNTDIILLDEPTNHLDLHFKFQVFNLLKQVASQQKKVILLATHELNMAMQICDKIILLHDGKILNDTPE